jgi:flavodoxin I
MNIGLFFGTSTGNTEDIADMIKANLGLHDDCVHDVNRLPVETLLNYDFLIMGIPTWHIGEMQDDWAILYEDLDQINLGGRQIALFGLGDQEGYPDTFLDGMGILYEKLLARGASGEVGFWPTTGFEFDESKALVGEMFCGLALDTDCQPELTEERVDQWCALLCERMRRLVA